MTCYYFVEDVRSWQAYACAVFQAGSGYMIVIATQSYVAKRTPKMIRGMTYAFSGCLAMIGMILYLQLAQLLIT